LSVVYNGVHPAFSPAPDEVADRFIDRLIAAGSQGGTHPLQESAPADPASLAREFNPDGPSGDEPAQPTYLLHVGSTIPRKRIDILLQIVASVREQRPMVRLLKAGGNFTSAQQAMIHRLNLEPFVVSLPYLEPSALAALYRRASVVLLPSEREGFGLPIVESMACCTPVVATDSAVFHEVGGTATLYAPFGDIIRFRNAVLDLLLEAQDPMRLAARRRICLEQAAPFTWRRHAGSMAAIYREVRHFAEMRHPAPPSNEEAELAS
jgi:glycosyltransferase involved in cell wall biosynthesis